MKTAVIVLLQISSIVLDIMSVMCIFNNDSRRLVLDAVTHLYRVCAMAVSHIYFCHWTQRYTLLYLRPYHIQATDSHFKIMAIHVPKALTLSFPIWMFALAAHIWLSLHHCSLSDLKIGGEK